MSDSLIEDAENCSYRRHGSAAHVTHRGNKQEDVFLHPGDREMYLGLLRERAQHDRFSLVGYC